MEELGEELRVKNVSAGFGRKKVLEDLSIKIPRNKIYALLGPNGSGKTTTFRVIANVLKPWSGEIECGNLILNKKNNYKNERYEELIGYLPEGKRLYDNLTVKENLQFWCKLYGINEERINEISEKFTLGELSEKKCRALSHGQKKRVSLARTLLKSPKILVLDEPFVGLDPDYASELRDLLKEAGKYTIIYSTHDLFQVDFFADVVGMIGCGKVLLEEKVKDLRQLLDSYEVKIKAGGNVKEVLGSLGYSVSTQNDYHIIRVEDEEEVSRITSALARNGCTIFEVTTAPVVEEIYRELSGL